jgi:hypothetical protein
MAVSFSKDIVPLFRKVDIDHMRQHQVFLDDYKYMSDPTGDHANATDVQNRLNSTNQTLRMPPDIRWAAAQLQLYDQWMKDGYQP